MVEHAFASPILSECRSSASQPRSLMVTSRDTKERLFKINFSFLFRKREGVSWHMTLRRMWDKVRRATTEIISRIRRGSPKRCVDGGDAVVSLMLQGSNGAKQRLLLKPDKLCTRRALSAGRAAYFHDSLPRALEKYNRFPDAVSELKRSWRRMPRSAQLNYVARVIVLGTRPQRDRSDDTSPACPTCATANPTVRGWEGASGTFGSTPFGQYVDGHFSAMCTELGMDQAAQHRPESIQRIVAALRSRWLKMSREERKCCDDAAADAAINRAVSLEGHRRDYCKLRQDA